MKTRPNTLTSAGFDDEMLHFLRKSLKNYLKSINFLYFSPDFFYLVFFKKFFIYVYFCRSMRILAQEYTSRTTSHQSPRGTASFYVYTRRSLE